MGVFAYERAALLRALITSHSFSIASWRQRKKIQSPWHRCFCCCQAWRGKVSTLQDQSFRGGFSAWRGLSCDILHLMRDPLWWLQSVLPLKFPAQMVLSHAFGSGQSLVPGQRIQRATPPLPTPTTHHNSLHVPLRSLNCTQGRDAS